MALKKITKIEVEQMHPGQLVWDAKHRKAVRGFGVLRQKDGAFYILRQTTLAMRRSGFLDA